MQPAVLFRARQLDNYIARANASSARLLSLGSPDAATVTRSVSTRSADGELACRVVVVMPPSAETPSRPRPGNW